MGLTRNGKKETKNSKRIICSLEFYSLFFRFVRCVSLGFTSFGYIVPMWNTKKPFFSFFVAASVIVFVALFPLHLFEINNGGTMSIWFIDRHKNTNAYSPTHALPPPTGLKLSSFHIFPEGNMKRCCWLTVHTIRRSWTMNTANCCFARLTSQMKRDTSNCWHPRTRQTSSWEKRTTIMKLFIHAQ